MQKNDPRKEIETLKVNVKELERNVKKLNAEIEEKQRRIEELVQEKEANKVQEQEISTLKGKVKEQEKIVQELQAEKEEKERRIQELEDNVNELRKDMKELKEDNEKLAKNMEALKEEKQNLSSDMKELKEDNQKLADDVKELKEDNQKLSEENKTLKVCQVAFGIENIVVNTVLPKNSSKKFPVRRIKEMEKLLTESRLSKRVFNTEEEKKEANEKWNKLKADLEWDDELSKTSLQTVKQGRLETAHPVEKPVVVRGLFNELAKEVPTVRLNKWYYEWCLEKYEKLWKIFPNAEKLAKLDFQNEEPESSTMH